MFISIKTENTPTIIPPYKKETRKTLNVSSKHLQQISCLIVKLQSNSPKVRKKTIVSTSISVILQYVTQLSIWQGK